MPVSRTLSNFPNDSNSPLTFCSVLNQTSALDMLTDFLNHLASGLVPQEVQPFLAGAYLIGLSKKDGGIRPIAFGDVYRRLTGNA